jgi:hypothetical protein
MRTVQILFIIGLALEISAPVFAKELGPSCLRDALRDMVLAVEGSPLLEAERTDIAAIYASSRSQREKLDAALEIFARAQARRVEAGIQKRFGKVAVIVGEGNDPEKVVGFYLPVTLSENVPEGVVKVLLPKRYQDSLIEGFIKSHEYQHVLNHAGITAVVPGFDYAKLPMHEQFYFRVADEMTAMISEYHYLNAIPRTERQAMLKVIRADKNMKPFARDFMERSLRAADAKDFKDYVRIQYENGRYTPEAIEESLRQLQDPLVAAQYENEVEVNLFKSKTSRVHRPIRPIIRSGSITGFTLVGFAAACAALQKSNVEDTALKATFCVN